jgi:hypothetical protein
MLKKYLLLIVLISPLIQSVSAFGEDETPMLLFRNVVDIMNAASASQLKGDSQEARNQYTTATYLLEKIQQDFPDWNSATVVNNLTICRTALGDPVNVPSSDPVPAEERKVTVLFKSVVADDDYEPEGGDIFEISLEGDDRSNLRLIYKKQKPFAGDARICLQTVDTPSNRFLMDKENPELFRDESGEILLELLIPAEYPIFLSEFSEGPYGNPRPLSNIIELPEFED